MEKISKTEQLPLQDKVLLALGTLLLGISCYFAYQEDQERQKWEKECADINGTVTSQYNPPDGIPTGFVGLDYDFVCITQEQYGTPTVLSPEYFKNK